MTDPYLDIEGLMARTIAPPTLVDGSWIDPSGQWTDPAKVSARAQWLSFVDAQIKLASSYVNARLRKRYLAPFASPYPEIVLGWVAAIVTPRLYKRRGWDQSDAQAEDVINDEVTAKAEIKEAADAEKGLFDLPLREDSTQTGASQATPLGYSESDPYEWQRLQREAARR